MGDVNLPIAGGCFCGAVRYEAVGKPVYVLYCHCESCRRATGAPVVAYLMLEKEMVRFTEGKRKVFESSPGVHRTFCSICGTPLTWEGVWGGRTVIELHLGTLDRPEAFPPGPACVLWRAVRLVRGGGRLAPLQRIEHRCGARRLWAVGGGRARVKRRPPARSCTHHREPAATLASRLSADHPRIAAPR